MEETTGSNSIVTWIHFVSNNTMSHKIFFMLHSWDDEWFRRTTSIIQKLDALLITVAPVGPEVPGQHPEYWLLLRLHPEEQPLTNPASYHNLSRVRGDPQPHSWRRGCGIEDWGWWYSSSAFSSINCAAIMKHVDGNCLNTREIN